MDRREFLGAIAGVPALLPGLSFIAGLHQEALAQVHAQARSAAGLRTLDAHQDATVSGIAELILPQTETPGARAVGVTRFIDVLLSEAMLPTDRDRFLEGVAAIDARSRELFGVGFVAAQPDRQHSLVQALDERLPGRGLTAAEREALEHAPVSAEHGYALLKALVVLGYFSSEPVAKLMNVPIIPGRYDGCVPV